MRFLVLALSAVGCGSAAEVDPVDRGGAESLLQTEPEDPVPDGAPESACGEATLIDLVVTGTVHDLDGEPIVDHQVWVEERSWMPGTVFGEGQTGPNGRVEFEIHDVPIVEGCWGVGPQFWTVISGGSGEAELPSNPLVVGAWLEGSKAIDLSGIAFELSVQ